MTLAPPKPSGDFLGVLNHRLKIVGALCVLAWASVFAGYWFHQVVRSEHYRQLAENNRLRRQEIEAPRGLIQDRRGRLLVENVPSYSLRVDRSRGTDLSRQIEYVAAVLGVDPAGLLQRLEQSGGSRFQPALLATDLDLQQVAQIEAASWRFPEFLVEVAQRRLYRHGGQAAHVLGYLGLVSEEDLQRFPEGLQGGDWIGRKGLERRYDERLRGRDGREVLVVDSRGRKIERVSRESAQAGEMLQLTLDLDLQQVAAEELADRAGVVVALDPRTGALRALVSSPSFDPNLFAGGLDDDQWRRMLAAPNDPLQNRSIQNAYSPGSVFKIVVGMAVHEEPTIDPSKKIWCGGQKRYYERPRRCWKRSGHGWVDLHDAIKHSCDIYFYEVGQELGVDRIAEWARRFGLGQTTGIDLEGERSGLVPSTEWSQRVRGTPWYPGETISVSIGQGPLLVTPLQVAVMFAAVANGGTLVTPHLVQSPEPQPTRRMDLDRSDLEALRRALDAVVNDGGSGRTAALAGQRIAGKTGTAQVVEQRTWTESDELPYEQRDHSWFASFAPTDSPELVVVAFVEHGGLGSRVAAPLARKIYERHFRTAAAQPGS